MVYQEYVTKIRNQVERRRKLSDKQNIQTDAFMLSIKKTMEEIRNRRAEIDSVLNANTTEQLDALWKYVRDLDCILDGLEKSYFDTVALREAV